MQTVFVYLKPFWCNSLLKRAQQPKIAKKNTKIPHFQGSFKVIDVDTIKKLVASACYDKQHICAYLQLFSCRRANSSKITTFSGVPLFDFQMRKPP